ncbi:hypothetical protein D3C81_2082210 [compost metagenome]
MFSALQADTLKQPVHFSPKLLPGSPAHLSCQRDILCNRVLLQQLVGLKDNAHFPPQLIFLHAVQRFTIYLDRTLIVFNIAIQQLKKRALARSRATL